MLKKVSALALALATVLAPLNFSALAGSQGDVDSSNNQRTILYYAKDNVEDLRQHLETSDDEFLVELREEIDNNDITFTEEDITHIKFQKRYKSYEDLVFPAEVVEEDPKLQKQLHALAKKGTKIYLYSKEGITLDEYANLLNLKNLNVEMYPENVSPSAFDTKPQLTIGSESKHEIIGYTLEGNVPHQIHIADIEMTENNEMPDHAFLAGVLDDANNVVEEYKQSLDTDGEYSFLNSSKVSASTSLVHDPVGITKYTYNSSNEVTTKFYSDHEYWKQTNEYISGYDYFALKDKVQLTGYNGYNPGSITIKHTPHSDREVESSKPSDYNGSANTSYTFSIPWGASVTFSNDGSYSVDNQTSFPHYAKWYVNDINESSFTFEALTEIKSPGTHVAAYVSHDWSAGAWNKIVETGDNGFSFGYNY